jgi:hypothetical protein
MLILVVHHTYYILDQHEDQPSKRLPRAYNLTSILDTGIIGNGEVDTLEHCQREEVQLSVYYCYFIGDT